MKAAGRLWANHREAVSSSPALGHQSRLDDFGCSLQPASHLKPGSFDRNAGAKGKRQVLVFEAPQLNVLTAPMQFCSASLLFRQVKSFLETQKALLTEIQNGCKRNFVLAKEKEEKEQKLQQSASMPEITITEPLEEEEEEQAEEDGQNGDMVSSPEEVEEVAEAFIPRENGSAEQRAATGGATGGNNLCDSDSDTEEEEEEKEETSQAKTFSPSGQHSKPNHAEGPLGVGPLEKGRDTLGAEDKVSPSNAAEEEIKCESRIRTTSSVPLQVNSPGNEKRISVSSPGRGHKIFVVTRVESLPEKEEARAAQQKAGPAAPSVPPSRQADSQPVKTEGSKAETSETVAGPTASLESPPPTPCSHSGPDQMNSGSCEDAVHLTLLPNGVKTEFLRVLPDMPLGYDGKRASCAVEHGKKAEKLGINTE